MNTPEKIANTYFRLNGFFLLPQFAFFINSSHIHVDLLALRPASGREVYSGIPLPIDDQLFAVISELINNDATQLIIGIIAEIRGNAAEERPEEAHIAYTRNFFGPNVSIIPIAVSTKPRGISIDNRCALIPLAHMLEWSLYRFRWMDQNIRDLSKTGSWAWSEDALADLLYLQKIGFTALDMTAKRRIKREARNRLFEST